MSMSYTPVRILVTVVLCSVQASCGIRMYVFRVNRDPTEPLLNLVLGHLRSPTTVVYLTQASHRASQRRRRRYVVVLTVCSIRCPFAEYADLPQGPERTTLCRHAGQRLSGSWATCPPRAGHHKTSSHPHEPGYWLQRTVLQPGVRDQDRRYPEGRERCHHQVSHRRGGYHSRDARSFSMEQGRRCHLGQQNDGR